MVSRSGRHRNRGVLICSQFWLGSSTSRDSNSFLRSCCADSSSSQISADTCVSLLQGKLQVSASLCKTSANLRRANIEILAREIPYFWPSPGGPAGVQDAQGAHGYAQSPYFTKIIPTTIRWLKISGKFPMDVSVPTLKIDDSAWVKPCKIQNFSTEIGRSPRVQRGVERECRQGCKGCALASHMGKRLRIILVSVNNCLAQKQIIAGLNLLQYARTTEGYVFHSKGIVKCLPLCCSRVALVLCCPPLSQGQRSISLCNCFVLGSIWS